MRRINLAEYRIQKAQENLQESEDALRQDHFGMSVNRSYYAMFTSARAILTLKELDSSKHSGVIALFGQHIVIVTFCKSEQPRLRIIQDPITKLNHEILYCQVQFMVEKKDWASQGEEIDNHNIMS